LNEIQALEALVSIFGSDFKSIEGGNWQIFAHMILESRAKFHLNTPVIGIEEIDRDEGAAWRVYTEKSSQLFDGVVLASPYVPPRFLPDFES
jgi:prenylcysteine oxidase/farnesylcysteine lyase